MQEHDYKKQIDSLNEAVSSQEILDAYEIIEYTADDIIRDFENAKNYKQEQARVFKILDAADHSDIWKTYNKKIPPHVQTPVNNPITIIKEATKASIMPTDFSGEYRPLTMAAKEVAEVANKFFYMKWKNANLDEKNSEAADYAFLHGTSGVLFGWNPDIPDTADIIGQFSPERQSHLQCKTYHPNNIFPDPTAIEVDEMRYLFFAERKSKDFLRTIPRFQRAMHNIVNAADTLGNPDNSYILDKNKQDGNDVVTFLICYKKVFRETVDEITNIPSFQPVIDIIYMAGRDILDVSKGIQPNCIPFVPLYDERIPNNFWGISKCYKVLSMVLTLNQLDSTEATAYFRNQNPAEFVNTSAGLDVSKYQNTRLNPDSAYYVNIDPEKVHAYAKQPELPRNLDSYRQYLITMIQQVSGVDSAYLGRSYGSIQTTGGVEQAISRATMRDAPRIKLIDKFIRKELELMTQFYLLFGQEENFFPYNQHQRTSTESEPLTFDPTVLLGRDDIEINVSNVAPRSNMSYEDAAQKLFELQMKYSPGEKGYPDIITPEELIGWMNIPKAQKDVLIERMRNQMQLMKEEEYTAVLTAVGTLVSGGMPVEMAIQEVAKQIEGSAMGQVPAANPNPGAPMPR